VYSQNWGGRRVFQGIRALLGPARAGPCSRLGHAIFKAGSLYIISKVFAGLVATIGLALFLSFIVGKVERLLIPWRRY